MNRKRLKKVIIGLTASIIIVIILLMILLGKEKKEEQMLTEESENIEETQKIITSEDRIEQYDFLVVSDCVSSYLSEINQNSSRYYGQDENNEYKIVVEQEQINKNAYNLLSSEYIEKKAITLDNVYEYVPKVNQKLMFIPLDMKLEKGENVNKYMIYGNVIDLEYNFLDDLYVIVNLDIENKSFSIEPIDKKEYQEGKIENNNIRIEVKENNKYSYQQLSEEYRLKKYFQNYKRLLLSNIEVAYQFLDSDYKEKCFGNFDNFKKYVNENRNKIAGATLEGYEAKTNGNYMEYVEKDVSGNYYIFDISNENATEFKVMLDNYIIGYYKINEEYDKGNDQKKVTINTVRFINAINEKKYYYAYSILAESFKNDKFSTQEEFEEYVKENFFENNTIQEGIFREEGKYYTYDLTLSDNSGNTRKVDIIMKLNEGRDFEMSFSIEE